MLCKSKYQKFNISNTSCLHYTVTKRVSENIKLVIIYQWRIGSDRSPLFFIRYFYILEYFSVVFPFFVNIKEKIDKFNKKIINSIRSYPLPWKIILKYAVVIYNGQVKLGLGYRLLALRSYGGNTAPSAPTKKSLKIVI